MSFTTLNFKHEWEPSPKITDDIVYFVNKCKNLLHWTALINTFHKLSLTYCPSTAKNPHPLPSARRHVIHVRGTTISPKELRSETPQMALLGILNHPAAPGVRLGHFKANSKKPKGFWRFWLNSLERFTYLTVSISNLHKTHCHELLM